ncbi:AMP-binding protein [Mycobacterium sp. CBMA293]|nr:AMP-binding protein [Mycolicibacterium sp. CBMA 360]MUL59997.1 AMP-binding protein [Mycolicibacterium sp. CBMA 335]MUL68840.1 AMP-binding protein [Mycolicibacterium sp. CBMA 311]MUL93769.1 AMP-binding protein [Mycolicibacterium sp. CBMA 230]MUM06012.1 peptide synthase [Mycolicibacterium sp. CBMA 213]MUM12971.1 AMP-binding protein [Mycolicibacterium sp. CBMA 293]
MPLSSAQQNIYRGVLQDPDPALYLIGKSYRFHPVELPTFLSALEATVLTHPAHLCVLLPSEVGAPYPDLVAGLRFQDIVHVHAPGGPAEGTLSDLWQDGILDAPLVRYTVHTDGAGHVVGMQAHTHHILLDGAATAIIEADLARNLTESAQAASSATATAVATTTAAALDQAHRYERAKVVEAGERLAEAVRRELTEQDQRGGPGDALAGTAGRGVLRESVQVGDSVYREIVALAEAKQVPLNILVAAAAVAVHASLRQSTESLLVHPVDNRFGTPELNVATCLVNSVAQLVRFAPFASVRDVVSAIDRGYVKAARRRWFREELYRRMYLAINGNSHAEALTVNFMRGRCAPELGPYLSEPPAVTDIGPVEGMTVACVHDEAQRTIDFAIWNRDDLLDRAAQPVAERIVATLQAMAALWDEPIALAVGEWHGLSADGSLVTGTSLFTDIGVPAPERAAVRAWFLDEAVALSQCRSPGVDRWIAEIVCAGIDPGDVLVFVDDDSQGAIELLIACHLAGCGHSVCATPGEVALRINAIAEHCAVTAHVVDVAAPLRELDVRQLSDDRIDHVAHDSRLAHRLAYVMPTSGSTGQPKLVPVTHGALAIFCAAVRAAYGWGPADTVLQCAPLTSDISVEEVFGAVSCGSRVVRSAAMRAGDLPSLIRDVAAELVTVLDLPTSVWHLLCEDDEALVALGGSALRQVIIGGEAVRSTAVDKWLGSAAGQGISLVSTYGPTETTVVVTQLPIGADEPALAAHTRTRLGRPLLPNSVFVAFGEVIVVGDMVSTGYLGQDGASFGAVQADDGTSYHAFATGDRVTRDSAGFPVLAGRRDAVVKIAGQRVDTAEVLRRVASDPEITDVAVELAGNGLGIWFTTMKSRNGIDDPVVAARVRATVRGLGVPSFSVASAPDVPRKPNGKVDREKLLVSALSGAGSGGAGDRAFALAATWSRLLDRVIGPDASLLDEGIGSLELIRILPATRSFLGWQLTILDLITADSAVNVVDCRPDVDAWMDPGTAAEIAHDLATLDLSSSVAPVPQRVSQERGNSIVILGASGILGTGFARAILDRKQSGLRCAEVVFVARSPLPEHDPWSALQSVDGVTIIERTARFAAADLGALLADVGAGTVVNCIGNTNVLVRYGDLRAANVDAVSSIADACRQHGARLVHLSTFVVNAEVTAASVTDPRFAPYPYAASKSLAELAVTRTPGLDFTVVRLPRVLGDTHQLEQSADILVSILDACIALQLCPHVPLTEEVTTGVAAAHAILGLVAEASPAVALGRGMTVLRGEKVRYTEFLGSFGFDAIDIEEWKCRLDRGEWAARNPSKWAVIDAWVGLGARLHGRTYADYLADYPTVDIDFERVTECVSTPQSLRTVLAQGGAEIVRN